MEKFIKWGLLIFIVFPIGALLIMGGLGYLIGGKSALQTQSLTPTLTPTLIPTITQTKTVAVPTTIQTQPQKAEIVFDLEKLYGKNINEIRTILGPPTDGKLTNPTEQQIKLGTKQWDNTFKKGNYELLVTYNVSDKSVIDFFIPTDDSSGATKDTKNLEEIGNIVNTNKFTIEQVKTIRDPSIFTGIKITPKK